MEQTQSAAPVAEVKAAPEKAKTKRKFKLPLPAIIAAAAVVLVGIVVLVICLINAGKDTEKTVYDTDAFFIRETSSSSSLYALFKKDGSRKTDFVFSSVGNFVNDHALVRNAENKYGVVDHDGNMSIDFGTFDYIDTRGGLYEVRIDGKRTLINSDGGEVIGDYEEYVDSYDMPYVAIKTGDKEYKLFNAFGDEILSFESEAAPKFTSYDKKLAGSMRYDGHTVLLNNKTLKVAKNIESETSYTLNSASRDLKSFIFSESGKYSDGAWATYHNDKFVEYGDKCKSVSLVDESRNDSDRKYLTCRTDKNLFLIRNGEVSDIDVSYGSNNYVAFDENHYASFDSKDSKITVYVDGKEKTKIDGNYAPTVSNNSYFVRDTKNKRIAIYDLDGNQVYELKDVTYGELSGVDKNGNIIVNDPSQSNSNERYYIVNKNGDQISSKYSSVARHGAYYSAFDYTNKKGELLDKDGKAIVSGEYKSFDYYKDEQMILGRKENSQFDLIDAEGRRVLGSYEGRASVNTNGYFMISGDDKNVYYTFDGKEIYQQKKQ